MVCTYQDIKEFNKQIKELLDKGLTRINRSFHTNPTFTARNHAEEKRRRARMVIKYKTLNDNAVFNGYYIPNKTIILIEFKEPLSS